MENQREEYDLLRKCLKDIEEKVRFGDSSRWTNNEFSKLSRKIYEETRISISVSSLRRLYGKSTTYKKVYNPQIETKNALASFIGYENWADYIDSSGGVSKRMKEAKPGIKWGKNLVFALLVAVLIVIGVFVVGKYPFNKEKTSKKTSMINAEEIKFEGKDLFGKDLPHTVRVQYDITAFPNDTFYIDFGVRPQDGKPAPAPILLDHNLHLINHTYNYKSIYNIQLLDADFKPVKTIKAFIQTNGWEGYIKQNYVILKYDSASLKNNGVLTIPYADAYSRRIDTNFKYRSFYRDIQDFDVNIDNLEAEIRFKTSFRKGFVECNHFQWELVGDGKRVFISILEPGCHGSIKEIEFSETRFSGYRYDLSKLGFATSDWGVLNLKIKDQQVLYLYDNDSIFGCTYEEAIGQLKGIRFEISGQGYIDYVYLKNLETGEWVYRDDF